MDHSHCTYAYESEEGSCLMSGIVQLEAPAPLLLSLVVVVVVVLLPLSLLVLMV